MSSTVNEGLGLMDRSIEDRIYHRWKLMDYPKCPIPIFFKIDMYAFLNLPDSRKAISNGNMQKRNTKFGPIMSILPTFNSNDVFNMGGITSEIDKDAREQEFLIEKEVDLQLIPKSKMRIVVPNQYIKDFLVNNNFIRIGEYKNRIEVDSMLFNYENRTVFFTEEDDSIRIECPLSQEMHLKLFLFDSYKGIAPFDGNIIAPPINKDNYKIFKFNGSLTVQKNARFTVTLHDQQPDSKDNKQDWLLYSNDENWESVLKNLAGIYSNSTHRKPKNTTLCQ